MMNISDLVNESECDKIIQRYSPNLHCKLINYDIQPLRNQEIIGFMGEYYELTIQYSQGNVKKSANFFVKTVPLTDVHHRNEITTKGFFDKETAIYENILNKLKEFCLMKHFPECYYTRTDLIVLENLKNDNYQNLLSNNHQFYTMDLFMIVLKSLAAIHTASIVYEYKNQCNIDIQYGEYLKEVQADSNNSWYTAGLLALKAVALVHPKYQNPEILQFLEENLLNILQEADQLTNSSSKYKNVFCHRDAWDRNILFQFDTKQKPINCVFVDYQLSRYCPPAIDVLFTLYLNTTYKYREEISDQCLRYYHNCLIEKFEEFQLPNSEWISWHEFEESCHAVKLIIIILKAVCAPITHLPAGWSDDLKSKDPEQFHYYMTCNRNEMILNLMKQNQNYKNIILETVEEVVDYILNSKYYQN